MDIYCEFYDGQQELRMCVLHVVVILIYMDGFKPLITYGQHLFCPINKCTNNVQLYIQDVKEKQRNVTLTL
jgi:hypothetical protein